MTENKNETFKPDVNRSNEFMEIATDFGDPLEAVREAISNSYDHNTKSLYISFELQEICGEDLLVIEFIDDGDGMSYDNLRNNF